MTEPLDNDMKTLLEQAQKVQNDFKAAQKDFANKTFVAIAGIDGEDVKIVINGIRKVEDVKIGEGARKLQDVRVLEKLIKDAVNKATDKLDESMQEMMMKIYKQSGAGSNDGKL